MGNDNIVFMCRAIGYEHIQVNAIRVIADTTVQEKSESPRSEELSTLGSEFETVGGLIVFLIKKSIVFSTMNRINISAL